MNQRSITLPILLTLLISVIVFGSLGYYLTTRKQISSTEDSASTSPTVNPSTRSIMSATTIASPSEQRTDWKTYSNSTYGFQFQYPPDWTIKQDKLSAKTETEIDTYKGIILREREGKELAIHVQPGEVDFPFDAYVVETIFQDGNVVVKDKNYRSQVQVGSIQTSNMRSGGNTYIMIYTFLGDDFAKEKSSNLDLFEQILSSFKLTQ